MDELRSIAMDVVGRAVGFAVLGIGMTMLGFSYDLLLMMKVGAVATTLLAAVLTLKAERAGVGDHRKTHFWQAIPRGRRPVESTARYTTYVVLKETYAGFALQAAIGAGALWTIAIVLMVVRRTSGA